LAVREVGREREREVVSVVESIAENRKGVEGVMRRG
jgi:hypothetical protein